jgi:hypothetical protein
MRTPTSARLRESTAIAKSRSGQRWREELLGGFSAHLEGTFTRSARCDQRGAALQLEEVRRHRVRVAATATDDGSNPDIQDVADEHREFLKGRAPDSDGQARTAVTTTAGLCRQGMPHNGMGSLAALFSQSGDGLVESLGVELEGQDVVGTHSAPASAEMMTSTSRPYDAVPASSIIRILYARITHSGRILDTRFVTMPVKLDLGRYALLEAALLTATRSSVAAVIVTRDKIVLDHLDRLVDLAARYRVPTMYGSRPFANAGGLIAYGPDPVGMTRRAAVYVDWILKGAKPGDLPVEQPTKFDLVVNHRTAKALGLTIPPSLLARADQVMGVADGRRPEGGTRRP